MIANNYKGTGAVFVRTFVRTRGPEVEQRLLAALTPEETAIYLRTFEFDWIPITVITRLFLVAAPLLFPKDVDGMRLIGREMARDHLRGIYRIMLRAATVPFVISQTAKLWSTYHRKGAAYMQLLEPKFLHFVVQGYPDLPERFRESLCGYIIGVMELVGAKDIRVAKTSDNPGAWLWKVAWK